MHKICFGICCLLLLLFVSVKSNCQLQFDTTFFKSIPFKESYSLSVKNKDLRQGLPGDGMHLYSNSDSVYSLLSGTVGKIVLIDSMYGIDVRSNNNTDVIYYNFLKVFVKEGAVIKQGEPLGQAGYNTAPIDYSIHINIRKNKKSISEKAHMAMLCSLAKCSK